MSNQAYVGTAKRTFQHALVHQLESDYGLLSSRRILSLLAEDVQQLVEQFYPPADHLRPGWVVFTGTKAEGGKSRPGQETCERTSVTIAWPLLTPDDLDWMTSKPDTKEMRNQLCKQRMMRLIEHGWQHPNGPVLLTLADLSLLLGVTTPQASGLLQAARGETGKPLLTMGHYFDQGMRPTHKAEIVALYEQGHDEADIARLSHHAATSVGRYLRDYERVKVLILEQQEPQRIAWLLDMQPSVVQAYTQLVRQHQPSITATGLQFNGDSETGT
jgi:hypothetical protein